MKLNDQKIQSKVETLLNSKLLEVKNLEFIPIGDDSFSWSADSNLGKIFIKLSTVSQKHSNIKLVNKLLQNLDDLDFIVPPIEINGETEFSIDEGLIFISKFIDGKSVKISNELFDKSLVEKLTKILSEIHLVNIQKFQYLVKETFNNKFKDQYSKFKSQTKQADINLFIESNNKKIEHIIEEFDLLCTKFQRNTPNLVLTHGDVTGLNIMITTSGEIKLLDWDCAMIAPKERDIEFIDDNQYFSLQKYFELTKSNNLDQDLMKYYGDVWSLDTIFDNLEKLNNYDPKFGTQDELWQGVHEYLGYY